MTRLLSLLTPSRVWLGLVFCVTLGPAWAGAQPYFTDCATRTATNASLVLPADVDVDLGKAEREPPWHIAVFTPDGECAGWTRWMGEATSLTAWGTAPSLAAAPGKPALAPGDSMQVRLYHPATDTEYREASSAITVSLRSGPPPARSSLIYAPDALYVVDHVRIRASLVVREK
jgi:hypothetical protein